MTAPVRVAVPRKGRPLEAVLDRFASRAGPAVAEVADDVASTLRFEKAVTKGSQTTERDVYARLAAYSTVGDATRPDYTLLRDDREGKPRRVVFDSVTVELDGHPVELIGREEPFRALRKHEFALGFDSADLVLEEVVGLRPDPLSRIEDLNARIDPHDTDVRVVGGLDDTVYHTLLGRPEVVSRSGSDALDRALVDGYEGPLCISPRYERLVEAVLGTRVTDGVDFCYPDQEEEEAAIADAGLGVYLTVTGSTARDHGLVVGERLFPSETVLMENVTESTGSDAAVRSALLGDVDTAIPV